MTSFFTWNMRGFNLPRKHVVLKNWVRREKLCFGSITETRVQQTNHDGVMKSALPGWKSITNYEYNRLGRIWFVWNDEVEFTLLHKSAQIITCAVQVRATRKQLMCSAIYASNFIAERKLL